VRWASGADAACIRSRWPASGSAKGQGRCHEVCEGRPQVHCASGSRSLLVAAGSGGAAEQSARGTHYTPSRRQLCGRHHGVTMATGVASLPLPGSPRAGPAKLPRRPPPARAIHQSEARALYAKVYFSNAASTIGPNETNNRLSAVYVQDGDERMQRERRRRQTAGPFPLRPLRPATDWPHEFTSADLALISGTGARRFRTLQNCWAVPLSRIPSAGDGRPMFRGQ
jgi:hypothetical protein